MGCYEFSVGKVRCVVVSDGSDYVPAKEIADMFPPQPEIQAALTALPEPVEFAYNCLLIESDGQIILVDTGQGTLDAAHKPQLVASLREANIAPEQVQIVVLTHGHADHIGGVVNDEGQLVYPNARYAMSRLDWDYWTGPAMRPISEKCLLPLKERLTLIEPDAQIVPGVTAIAAYGHTPGHIAILVESEGEMLIDYVDAVHHPLQITHPDWSALSDKDTAQSVPSRKLLAQRAVQENCRIMAYHFPFSGLGTVSADDENYRFVPETA